LVLELGRNFSSSTSAIQSASVKTNTATKKVKRSSATRCSFLLTRDGEGCSAVLEFIFNCYLLKFCCRESVTFRNTKMQVYYRGPCGRRIRNMLELMTYLRTTRSSLPADLFSFDFALRVDSTFVVDKPLYSIKVLIF